MKRIGLFILPALFLFALCSCSNNEITLKLPTGEITGTYSGDFKKKLPHGTGTFVVSDDSEDGWTYSGEWSEGLMDGKGECKWSDGRVYIGEYESGYIHGVGSMYENDTLLFTGSFADGKLIGLVRKKVKIAENEPMQYIKVGEIGFQIPKSWSCEVIDNRVANIKIPDAENVQIIFSISEYIDGKKDSAKKTIKEKYIKQYGSGYSEYLVASESQDGYGYTTNNDDYDLQLTFLNGENVLDVYSHSVFRDPILSEPTMYTVTTVIEGGAYDYSDAAQHITKTMKNWDKIQEDIEEQNIENAKKETMTYLNGEVDWNGLEATAQKVSKQDMLDRTCPKNSIVLVEGIISNISDSEFDVWLPHDSSYFNEEGWKYSIDLGDISEGSTVQICIETHADGSLNTSDGILAIRKLDVPNVDNIVEKYMHSCKSFDYSTVMRNPDNAYGTIWKAKGTVFQVVETKGSFQEFLLQLSDGNYVYVNYHKSDDADNVLEGDSVTVYGTFFMTKTYITVLGAENTVPILTVDYITIQ